LLLRWFWWRINAWSEVSAMIAAAAVSIGLQVVVGWDTDQPREFAYVMLVTVGLTTIAWAAITWLTPPESEATLLRFYRQVRPDGPGWRPIAALSGDGGAASARESLARQFLNWLLGCVLIYGWLFGIGGIVLGRYVSGLMFGLVGTAAGVLISRSLSQQA